MIPVSQLDPVQVQTLVHYLEREIPQALGERAPLEERWIKYHFGYRAIPEEELKLFPFYGAANLVIPVIATDVDTIFSRLMGILFAPDNLWSCKPLNELMIDYAPRLQEFLQWAQTAELGVYNAAADFIMELCKLGTGVLKTRYTREQRQVYQFRETDQGTIEQIMTIMLKDHPTVEHVSLPNFLIPSAATTIQDAPWVSERLQLTWGQLLNRANAGLYQGVDRLSQVWGHDRGSRVEQFRERQDAYEPSFGDKFDVWESWLDFDVSGTGQPMAIVATMHLPTRTLLRVDYNPFFNQEKPFSSAPFLRQEKRFYGIGLAEMLDSIQDEVSAMHNQRLDNATLANSVMMKARKGIGIKEDEPIFPGRWFLLDNMEDVQPMAIGQRFDSTVQYEELTVAYGHSRTGVSDYISGASTPAIGYGAATTALQQLQEGSKRFDQTLRECRRCFGEIGTRVVELYQQFNQHGKEYLALGPDDGAQVHTILQFPMELIRTSIGIELTATSASLNKDVEIRTNQIVLQMIMQFYQQLFQGVGLMINPQVPPQLRSLAEQMVGGGIILMRRILDSYGIQDAKHLIPAMQEVLNGGQQQLGSIQNTLGGGQTGFAPVPPFQGIPNPSAGLLGAGQLGLQTNGAGFGGQ